MLKIFQIIGLFALAIVLAILDYSLFFIFNVQIAFILYNIFALLVGIALAVLSFKIEQKSFSVLVYIIGFSMVVIHLTKLIVRTCI